MDKIYHYKNGHKFDPIVIAEEDEAAWVLFCQRIAQQYPNDPHPYWEDVVRFRKQRQAEKEQQAV